MKKTERSTPDFQNKNHFSGENFPAVFFNVPIPHDLRFDNCEINYIVFFEDESYETRSFEFNNCKIDKIEIRNKIFQISFENCVIGTFFQEPESIVELLFFNAVSSDYKIQSLFFRDGKTSNCIIEGYSIDLVSTSNHSFSNIEIQSTSNVSHFYSYASKYSSFDIFQINDAEFQFLKDSTIMFYEVDANKISFKDDLTNSKVTLYSSQIQELIFERLKNSNSFLLLETISVIKVFKLAYSDLGRTELIDCDISTCHLQTKASTLTLINSIRVNWPKDIDISDPDNKLTEERRYLEKMEFWRQLKVNAINQKNHFNALQFYTREMGVKFYSFKSFPQIDGKSKLTEPILWIVNPVIDLFDLLFSSFKRRNAEGIMLWWHKYTSSFGIDWFRPTLIYLVSSYCLFFWLSEYSFAFNLKLDIFKDPNFYYFLDPLKSKKIEFVNHPTFVIAAASLITSVLQGLLIYQIIQGFRKYSFKS